jgi:hypothetical protein
MSNVDRAMGGSDRGWSAEELRRRLLAIIPQEAAIDREEHAARVADAITRARSGAGPRAWR